MIQAVDGKAHHIQGCLRQPPHGIDIAEAISHSHPAEVIGIIHHGGEEIHSLDQGQFRGHLIDPRIIKSRTCYQDVGVPVGRQSCQHFSKGPRTHFRRSPGSFHHLGEADFLCS